MKEQAWENLLQEFNSHPNVTKRNVKQLKLFYDNYKRKSKKKYADEKVERMKTRGGVTQPNILDDSSAKLLALIKDQIEPLVNTKDSDATFHDNHYTPGNENTSQNSESQSQLNHSIYYSLPMSDDCQSHTTDAFESHVVEVTMDNATLEDSPQACVGINVYPQNNLATMVGMEFTDADTEDPAVCVPEVQLVQSTPTPSSSSSWSSRNRPNLKRKQSERCSENIASLAEERKVVIGLECQLMKNMERKDDSLRDLKMQVQQKNCRLLNGKDSIMKEKLLN
ncbi:hypothetical protein C0J52_10397 [Blattella germanica]|nr:hypothetical protein C0J52_10397 [Blattella germanica]